MAIPPDPCLIFDVLLPESLAFCEHLSQRRDRATISASKRPLIIADFLSRSFEEGKMEKSARREGALLLRLAAFPLEKATNHAVDGMLN